MEVPVAIDAGSAQVLIETPDGQVVVALVNFSKFHVLSSGFTGFCLVLGRSSYGPNSPVEVRQPYEDV